MPTVLNFLKKYGIFLMAGFLVLLLLRSCRGGSNKEGFSWEHVRSVKVKKGDIRFDISTTGEVKPQNRLEVKPPIDGRLEEIFVKEGDRVKKGDLIAKLSSTERSALLDSALLKGGEDIKHWEETYRPTPLIAPIDGMVIVRSVEPGQTVDSGDAVVVISDRLIVDALVNETDVGRVRVGQKAEIVLDAYPERNFPAVVDHIAFESTLDNNVNIYHVDVLSEKVDPIFRSGMTAQVYIQVDERKNVLLLPQEAVVSCPPEFEASRKSAECVVTRLQQKKPRYREIETGLSNSVETEILSGIAEGETVGIVRKKGREDKATASPFSMGVRRR